MNWVRREPCRAVTGSARPADVLHQGQRLGAGACLVNVGTWKQGRQWGHG